jgi:hypothetical protein
VNAHPLARLRAGATRERPAARVACGVLALLASLSGCGGPAAARRTVPLRLAAASADAGADADAFARAIVTIDDVPLGPFALVVTHGVALPPGKHRVTVQAPDHFPFDREIDVPDAGGSARAAPIVLSVALRRLPE